jgi:hypothetical protein
MLLNCVNAKEITKVVYLPEVANDPRFDGLNKRLAKLESREPSAESWSKRNSHWFSLVGPFVVAAIFLIGSEFGWFNSIFDGRIGSKLNESNGVNANF